MTAVPIAFQIPTGLRVVGYTNAGTEELSENPYITYTQGGTTIKFKRIIDQSKYENGTMCGYRMINNLCTMLLPGISLQSSGYVTLVVERAEEISLGTTLSATATLNFAENDNLDENEDPIPMTSNEVTIKYAYAEVVAEKQGPASAHYDEEFSYDIVITNSGNLPAKVSKIADILPEQFTLSTEGESDYKISVKRGETSLVKDTDFTYQVQGTNLGITPVETGKLDLAAQETLTVTLTGKIAKS